MSKEFQDYDWRGIAMLTQQLGQLFEPSKAKLMSMEHEHEMNMLMAKQAWDTQNKQLEKLVQEENQLTTLLDSEIKKVNSLGSKDLVNIGALFGSAPENTLKVFEDNDVRRVSELRGLIQEYRESILQKQNTLADMKSLNLSALNGEQFSKRMTSDPGAEDFKEYNELAESDGIPGLSWEEKQKALYMYINEKENAFVSNEDDEDYNNAIPQKLWNGKEYEELRVRPEGVAFIAGYNSTLDKDDLDTKVLTNKITTQANKNKMVRYEDMDPKQLANLWQQTQTTLQTIGDKYDSDKNKDWEGYTMPEVLSYDEDGIYKLVEEAEKYEKMDKNDVFAYMSAMNNATLISKAMSKKGIPVHKELSRYGFKHHKDMDTDFNNAVEGVKMSAVDMYSNLTSNALYTSREDHASTVAMFEEFLKNYDEYDPPKRKQVIKTIYNWMGVR